MKIIVLAGGLSPERDVSLLSGAGICKPPPVGRSGVPFWMCSSAFHAILDKLEEVFDRPDGGLEISKRNLLLLYRDLDALRKS